MGDDDATRARLLANLAMELMYSHDLDRRARVSEEALALARRSGDPATLAHVLIGRINAITAPHTLGERLSLITDAPGELEDRCIGRRSVWAWRPRQTLRCHRGMRTPKPAWSPRTRSSVWTAMDRARASSVLGCKVVAGAVLGDPLERLSKAIRRSGGGDRPGRCPCGDYGLVVGGRLVAAVERKSLSDLVSSVTNGKFRYALGDLAALPLAAVVVEDRYSALFKQRHARPAVVADALAEYQVCWPTVPTVFCETRSLAEEWTYRFLAAAWRWVEAEPAVQDRTAIPDPLLLGGPEQPEPTVAEVRAWARSVGLAVPDRGRLSPEVWDAWRNDHKD